MSALLMVFGLLVRSAEAETKDAEEKKTVQLVRVDGIAFRLAAGTFLMALRPLAGPAMAALRAASTSFPSASATVETPVPVQLMAMSALLTVFGLLVRSAEAETKETEKKTVQLVRVDGIAFRLAAGTFLLALRPFVGPAMAAIRASMASTSFPS